jgi:diguanylate cyclase (GGDEF)-like protein
MEVRMYLKALQRSWWIVVLTALTAVAVALVVSLIIPPTFQTTANFMVSPRIGTVGDDQGDLLRSLEVLDRRSIVITYAEIMNSYTVLSSTLNSLRLDEATTRSDYDFSAVVLPDANIIELSVEGPSPNMVANIANTMGDAAINNINQISEIYAIDFLDYARVPTVPIRPVPLRDSILALALGLVMGAVLAIIREQLSTPIEAFLQRAWVDSISNAFNRKYIEDQLDETIADPMTEHLALSLVRLDGLSVLLDVLPQPIIQQVLRNVTDTMKEQLRGNDLVGRWDRNTFSVLMYGTQGEQATATMRRVQSALAKPMSYTSDGETVVLEPKVGIGEHMKGDQAHRVRERANSALDEAMHDETGLVIFKTRALVGF